MDIGIMAAPNTAYTGSQIKTHNNGQTVNNALAVPTDEKSIILNRFHLDDLIIAKDDNGVEGFIGFVRIGSSRERMHNVNRIGSLRKFVNGVCYNFTDAGLNTLGTCNLGAPYAEFGAGVKVPVNFLTAYFVQTDGLKLLFKKVAETVWNEYFISGVLPANQSGTVLGTIATAGGIQPNDTLQIKAHNINVEGTYESNQQTITIPRPSTIMSPGIYASSAYSNYVANNGRMNLFFSTFDMEIGTRVFTNAMGTINAGSGFYANDDIWIKTEIVDGYCVIVDAGTKGNWGAGDPSTPATVIAMSFVARANLSGGQNWQWMCANIGNAVQFDCFFVVATSRYVISNNPNASPIGDGIYYTSATEFIVIQNGYKTNNGDCTNGIILEELEP